MRVCLTVMSNRVPSREEWGDVKADSHQVAAFSLYGGKTVEEAIPHFVSDPIHQAQVLRYATPAVFDYYIFCFATHLAKEESAGESDMASVFLNLLLEKSQNDPKALARIYPLLRSTIEVIAGRQAFYDADEEIYGSFHMKRLDIELNLAKRTL